MKLVILNNKVYATHSDDQSIESKYPNCTFLIVPDGKYTAEHTVINEDGTTTQIIGGIECGDPAPTLDAEDTLANVRYHRLLEYPALGDVIDAICKAEDGYRTELEELIAYRKSIKAKYPKN